MFQWKSTSRINFGTTSLAVSTSLGRRYFCINSWMISGGPGAWLGNARSMVTWLSPPSSGCSQRGRCPRYVMETSFLSLPVFAHLSLGGVYPIRTAGTVLCTNGALLSPTFSIWWGCFGGTTLQDFKLDYCSLWYGFSPQSFLIILTETKTMYTLGQLGIWDLISCLQKPAYSQWGQVL